MEYTRKTSSPREQSPKSSSFNNRLWPGVFIRHTFLEVAPDLLVVPKRSETQRSRSCGDLPSLESPLAKDEDTPSSFGSERSTDESNMNTTDTTEIPSSKDSQTTTSSSVHDENLDSWRSKITPSARRRMRRRRAALDRQQGSDVCSKPDEVLGSSRQTRDSWTGTGGHTLAKGNEDENAEVGMASSADDVLQAAYKIADILNVQSLVDVIHAIGKCVENDTEAVSLGRDARFLVLLARLRECSEGLSRGRSISRVVWALGKVFAQGNDVAAVLARLTTTAAASGDLLESSSAQELSNTLWGLARIGSQDSRCRCHAEQLALLVVETSRKRVPDLTPQCLANSLWAAGKLGIRGLSVASFVDRCLQEMCCQRHLGSFSPQGLANSLWACARLQVQVESIADFCLAIAKEVTPQRLQDFLPQELSMTIWAVAKITAKGGLRGNRSHGGGPRPPRRLRATPEVEKLVLAATEEATGRLSSFSPQGLSNIGWALATLELTREPSVHRFLVQTANKAMQELDTYPPQAIANLFWALCRLNGASEDHSVHLFASAVAVQAESRIEEFEWQDLAGIISAMNRAELVHLPQVHSFATALTWYAAGSPCDNIGIQALLNMALSAARLGVEPAILLPLAERIDASFGGQDCFNDIDRRQWSEVRAHCCQRQPVWWEESDSWSKAAMLVRRPEPPVVMGYWSH